MPADLLIADAHLHIWDAQEHRYPWLDDEPFPFRYGDYSALPRRYLVDEEFLERREGFYWRTGGTFDTE